MSEKVFLYLEEFSRVKHQELDHFNWSRVLETTDILTRQYVPGL